MVRAPLLAWPATLPGMALSLDCWPPQVLRSIEKQFYVRSPAGRDESVVFYFRETHRLPFRCTFYLDAQS